MVKEAKDDSKLVKAMGDEFHAKMRQRLEEDSDYDPLKYPNAQKFYQPKK